MTVISNDNPSAFQTFMEGYWNQMATEIYSSFSDALSDFRATEGDGLHKRLIAEIGVFRAAGRFPQMADIQSAYSDPFWKSYDRIIVQEDLESIGATSPDIGVVR
ncbi:hypothetical protein [Erythrobacter sp.]|uniref:hypothetical protein n=1 Tax=Erythrobacter sp. TaxID=1042 RepID=UPI0025ECBFB9|nr:hypothetical protein [Erythrobacter sp.]